MDAMPNLIDSQNIDKIQRFLTLINVDCTLEDLTTEVDLNGTTYLRLVVKFARELVQWVRANQNRDYRLEVALSGFRVKNLNKVLNALGWEEYEGIHYPDFILNNARALQKIIPSDLRKCLEIELAVFRAELFAFPADPNEPARALFFPRQNREG